MSSSVETLVNKEYKYGFVTDIESDVAPRGLNEDIIRLISAKKGEPDWLLKWRLKAFRGWLKMTEPHSWPNIKYHPVDYQSLRYYAAPKTKAPLGSLDDVDPKLLETYQKLGIPLSEQKLLAGVAVDAIFDSVSVGTTYKAKLAEAGIIFCSFGEAVREHPELVQKYLGSVVPLSDNFFAALNAAVFSDGSFVYVPKGVRCPLELSTYFRINASSTGQFERTLIIAEEGSSVHYVEGCTAPVFTTNTLHSAVVEIIVKKGADVRYTTIQNWSHNVYNLVTKRAVVQEDGRMTWIDANLGSKVTMKYPSVYLVGERAHGEVLSVAFANSEQHQDAGAKMIHAAKNTTSLISSKSISKGTGRTSYRGLVKIYPGAEGSKSTVRCDALILDTTARSDTYPYMEVDEEKVTIGHEASVSKVGEEQLFYLMSRGLSEAEGTAMVVNGFIEPIVKTLPMDYAIEMNRLITLSMQGAIG
jgi:Fe-S cluster assembly protein SufB